MNGASLLSRGCPGHHSQRRHSGEGRNPSQVQAWIPAFAGM